MPFHSIWRTQIMDELRVILKEGFTDRGPEHDEEKELPASVTLTDAPLTRNGYAEARLAVEIPEMMVLPYEWITETRAYRRFSVPATVVNAHGRVSISED